MSAELPAPARLLRVAWLGATLRALRTTLAAAAVVCAAMALAHLAGVRGLGPIEAHWAVLLIASELAGGLAWGLGRWLARSAAPAHRWQDLSQLRCPRCGLHRGLFVRAGQPCAGCGQSATLRWDGPTMLLVYALGSLLHLALLLTLQLRLGLLLAVPLALYFSTYLTPKD